MALALKQETEPGDRESASPILVLPGFQEQNSRLPQVRPERLRVPEEICEIVFGENAFPVRDVSPFGLALTTREGRLPPRWARGVEFKIDGVCAGVLDLERRHVTPIRNTEVKVGFAVLGEPLCVETITGLLEARSLKLRIEEDLEARQLTPRAFRQTTLELRDMLSTMESQLNALDVRLEEDHLYPEDIERAKNATVPIAGQLIRDALEPALIELEEDLEGQPGAAVKRAYEFFRAKLGALIYQSPFSKRSLTKPLGYAGDYEMMNMIYYDRGMGASLFARALHHAIVSMPGGQAVKNRALFLHRKLCEVLADRRDAAGIKTLSVASGPAKEIQMLYNGGPEVDLSQAEFHLLDQDLDSLKHAQRRLRELSQRTGRPCNAKMLHAGIRDVISRGLEDGGYSLIYSAGLFDYLSDPVARMAVQQLYEGLEPGGKLVIGNFSPLNSSRFLMEMAWDWKLVYRTVDDMLRLGRCVTDDVVIEKEPLGINLFCVATRPA